MAKVTLKQAVKNNLSNEIQNIKVMLHCIRDRRDKRVWLFGAWMGNRFADNSRFLFQFLNEHKLEYGINEIVWVTRSESVCKEVREMGYTSVIIGTEESDYYHLKAGVHVICNSTFSDIDSRLSAGAKKVQLWHGVGGCKAVGRLNRERTKLSQKLADIFIWPFYEPGHWFRAYFLASSPENARVVKAEHGCSERHIFKAITPRLCHCERLKRIEEKVIEQIQSYSDDGYKIVLHLPTFRENSKVETMPSAINGFEQFLQDKKIIWVHKRHSADADVKPNSYFMSNMIELPQDFDINVLYDFIDLLVTDYSSAASDAYFKYVRTLEYCPDIDHYMNQERRFTADFALYHAEEPVTRPDDFLPELSFRLETMTSDVKLKYERVRKLLFSDDDMSLNKFMLTLQSKIKWRKLIGINKQ